MPRLTGIRQLILRNRAARQLWTRARAFSQERRARSEQKFYEKRASRCGRSTRDLRGAVRRRLGDRAPNPRRRGDLRVLYASRPSAWELQNVMPALERFCQAEFYLWGERGFDDTDPRTWAARRDDMGADLLEVVRQQHQEAPVHAFMGQLSGKTISASTVRAIGELGILTLNFALDDKVGFRGRHVGGRWTGPAELASVVDLNLTSAPDCLVKYEVEKGVAVFWPEGANEEFWRPLDLPYRYDVSFVGACYGPRPDLIAWLRKRGVEIAVFGPGWPSGSISAERMVEVYSQSRVNLGFGGIGYSTRLQCLKGRDFEVPACAAVYLTSHNPDLELCYEVGEEIVCYEDRRDCLERIRWLLSSPQDAEDIRRRARARVLAEHTWSARFREAFGLLGVLRP